MGRFAQRVGAVILGVAGLSSACSSAPTCQDTATCPLPESDPLDSGASASEAGSTTNGAVDGGVNDAALSDSPIDIADVQVGATSDGGDCGSAPGSALCAGKCVDLGSDSDHCGACGNACTLGSCWKGSCPTIMGNFSQVTVSDLAVDAYFAYATTRDGMLLKCPLAGCPLSATAVTVRTDSQFALAVNPSGVFWSTFGSGGGEGGSVSGCLPSSCVNGVKSYFTAATKTPYTVAVDQTNIYFIVTDMEGLDSSVRYCPLSGCPSQESQSIVTGALSPTYLALASGTIYWVDVGTVSPGGPLYNGATIKRCTSAPCSKPETVLAPKDEYFRFLHADESRVYWLEEKSGAIKVCPATGCPASGPELLGPSVNPFAVDGSNVYWRRGTNLVKCPVGGCAGTPSIVVSGLSPELPGSYSFIATDASYVYWFESTTLLKIPK